MPTIPLSIHKMRQTSATTANWLFSAGSGTSLVDASGNARTGTFGAGGNAPSWVTTGRHLNAIRFVGGNGNAAQWVEVVDDPTLHPANNSLLAWINPVDNNNFGMVVGKADTGDNSGYDLAVRGTGASATIYYTQWNGTTGVVAESTTALTAGTWYFVVGTYDGSNVRLYLNAVLEGTTALAGPRKVNTRALRIGSRWDVTSNSGFAGQIDNVQIRNVVMTAAQIAAEYQLLTRISCYA